MCEKKSHFCLRDQFFSLSFSDDFTLLFEKNRSTTDSWVILLVVFFVEKGLFSIFSVLVRAEYSEEDLSSFKRILYKEVDILICLMICLLVFHWFRFINSFIFSCLWIYLGMECPLGEGVIPEPFRN